MTDLLETMKTRATVKTRATGVRPVAPPPVRVEQSRTPCAETAAPIPADPILAGLRRGAPALLDRAGADARARFVALVGRRLALYLSDALTVFRVRVGKVASDQAPPARITLQDVALTSRPCVETLVPFAAARLSPSQLVAILATSCRNHAPGGLDWLRCREAVYGGANTLAREAMLDLASDDIEDGIRLTCERVVADRMIEILAAHAVPRPILARLSAPCDVEPSETARPPGARMRRAGSDRSFREQLACAIAGRTSADPVALFASAAGVARETVEAAICLRSPKGLASLAWRAGYDSGVAAVLQSSLARIPPDQVLYPTASGGFPLTEPEMLWQCQFLARSSAGLRASDHAPASSSAIRPVHPV